MEAGEIVKYTVDEYYSETKYYNCQTELRNNEIVCFSSPSIAHQRLSRKFVVEIDNYISRNNGRCEVFSAPTDVKLDDGNIVVPDVFIACNPDKFDNQKYNGAPDFVIEIVSTNWADDYCRKLHLYQQTGVREYWIVDPKKEVVTTYFFEEQISERYSFSDDIPVRIYNGKLCINIGGLLNK